MVEQWLRIFLICFDFCLLSKISFLLNAVCLESKKFYILLFSEILLRKLEQLVNNFDTFPVGG